MNKELEEAINFLEEMLKEYKTFRDLLEDLQGEKFEDTDKIYKQIETVLNYIENSIHKKVIEEKYLKMEKEYRKKVYDKRYDRYEAKVEEMYKAQVYRELLEVE